MQHVQLEDLENMATALVSTVRDFNDLLEFDKWYNEKCSKLYIELTEPKPDEKDLALRKKKK